MSYSWVMVLCTGLRPSRIRPVRCSPADRHNIAKVLIRDNGPVKVLLVPSEEQRLGPTIGPRGAWGVDSWRAGPGAAEVTLHGG